MKIKTKFPSAIFNSLKHYVYVYVSISGGVDKIIYVGQGSCNRCFAHLKPDTNSDKYNTINSAIKNGKLRIDILVYGVDEATALKVEAAIIDLVGLKNLKNKKRGNEAREYGRITTDDLIAKLQPDKIKNAEEFTERRILIRNNNYYSGITDLELYEGTRGVWRASMEKCKKAKYALSVHSGVVREVYLIADWHQGGSTFYSTRTPNQKWKERVEFVGRIADDKIRNKYLHKDVSELWKFGAQNPITYFGPVF